MPQDVKAAHDPAREEANRSLQGLVATRDDEHALADALERAFDYRGDVTLTLASGETVAGYIFDRRRGRSLADSVVRLLPPDSDARRTIPFSDIARIEFSGKDTAHGKTFENWVKRFTEKRLKGESAGIESESLD